MFILRKEFAFEASHKLPRHDGKCKRLHGHSWKLIIEVRGENLVTKGAKTGMLIDYGDISAIVKPLIENKLDHFHLNETLGIYPTSEHIARFVYEGLKSKLPQLHAIEVLETDSSMCRYER